MSENFKTFAVVNPHSANGRTGKKWPHIASVIRDAIGPFDFAMTTRPMEAPDFVRDALAKGYEMIVAVGGDGNNNEVINGFFDNDKPLNPDAVFGIIPGGTGGDLARILGVRSLPLPEIAATLKDRNAVTSDAGKVTFLGHDGNEMVRYFINIADLGIGGETVDIVNRTTKALGGRMSFLIGSLRCTLQYRNRHVQYSIDDGPESEGKFYLIVAALGRFFGGGMQIAPHSIHSDGLFDFMVLGDLTIGEIAKLGTRIYKGKHVHMDKVQHIRGKKLTAVSNEKVYIDIDGEQPGVLPATFEILPSSIRMKQLKEKLVTNQ